VRRTACLLVALAALAGGCRRNPTQLSSNLNKENKVTVRQVLLFYEGVDMRLDSEKRDLALPENPAGAMSVVVRELFKGPVTRTLARSFPPDTTVRGAFLLPDGTAFVDLGGPTLSRGWGTGAHEELMAIGSLVRTIASNFPEAKRVRILINGEPAETLAGHISLTRSLPATTSLP
jgi:spore germination protein GerM